MDLVFKALADPTRRGMLDSLRRQDGQTLGMLCAGLAMARQSATQHLQVLQDANLVTVVRRGRERLHYLNPVPIHDLQRRWIAAYEEPRLRILDAVRQSAEGHAMTTETPDAIPTYVYVTYIKATAEQVWHALTDADLTAAYWGHANVSDWQVGSTWEHRRADGSGIVDETGTVLEVDPPRRLVFTFGGEATVTFTVESDQDIVRLTVTHERLATQEDLDAISLGWPAVLANLKSLLETGSPLPQEPWKMPASTTT
ncbi:metalloregulator ArsR/SmtB family transcription factor [Dactylosporangium sp. NPDC050688]|uniref:ArsR/SmtB family transcription factor n=1 Tax=Dactylosporangium sp. NPDC050688 TaxID=3157217 RepID=UPI0033ED6559